MNRDILTKIIHVIFSLLITINLGLAGWSLTQIVALKEDVARLKASSFTNDDGLEVWKQISRIREDVAKLPTDSQPKWLLDRLDKIERQQDSIMGLLMKEKHNGA